MNTSLALDESLSLQENFLAGQTLLISKPLEWTSFDVVNKIRYAIKVKKVGHAGTLDPLATGLLIICTGKKTKTIEGLTVDEKEYTGIISLGQTTPSFDLETELSEPQDISNITEEAIIKASKKFLGEIEQTPPIFSALKIDGQRAYKAARKGLDIKMKPRQVIISEFEIEKIELPEIHFRIVCSKGTYIRSIANDIGAELGVGAHLKALCRTRSGDHLLKHAFQLDEFIQLVKDQQ